MRIAMHREVNQLTHSREVSLPTEPRAGRWSAPPRARRWHASSGVLCAVLAVGCGSSGQLHGSHYRDQEAQYQVGPRGSDWRALRVEEHNDLAWVSRRDGAVVQINSTCDPTSDVPLVSLTNHLLMGFTARDVREQELVSLDGREALRTHVVARLDGVPRELLLYVLKKDDCVYDMALIAPEGAPFASAQTEFEAFAHGFSTNTP